MELRNFLLSLDSNMEVTVCSYNDGNETIYAEVNGSRTVRSSDMWRMVIHDGFWYNKKLMVHSTELVDGKLTIWVD